MQFIMSESSESTQGREVVAHSADPQMMLPLNRVPLTAADVSAIYAILLGRHPEEGCQWVGMEALDSILAIATSEEARSRTLPVTELHFSEGKFGKFLTHRDDQIIGSLIRSRGYFEEDIVSQTMVFLEKIGVRVNNTHFLDIGANIGTHSIAALKYGFNKSICIEANVENYKLLKINYILNDFDMRGVVINAAASSYDGIATLELSPTNFGDHRIRVGGIAKARSVHGEEERREQAVPVRRLDTIFREFAIQSNLIGLTWIDTQGHEGHVLSGASELLAGQTPIVIEFWPYGLSRSGGYQMLREALFRRDRFLDLRRSLDAGSPVVCDIDQLDLMFSKMLEQESPTNSPHTDLLVL
ncbi:FkbM family methyltransferase [Methylobacterium sp. GXS13]|uniref:FkbM family methyltransferase n=1 Tax=Methylobacterium sp. GXS13 TaxID=1730094 RepID=UPI0009E77148|nr:FkbM family methyltransferase [Methylobacterium sp. GXS13]